MERISPDYRAAEVRDDDGAYDVGRGRASSQILCNDVMGGEYRENVQSCRGADGLKTEGWTDIVIGSV